VLGVSRHHLANVIVYGAKGDTIKVQVYLLQTANVITTGFYSFELRRVEQQRPHRDVVVTCSIVRTERSGSERSAPAGRDCSK